MSISIKEAVAYAHAQVLVILDNHRASSTEEKILLSEQLMYMVEDLQDLAGDLSKLTDQH